MLLVLWLFVVVDGDVVAVVVVVVLVALTNHKYMALLCYRRRDDDRQIGDTFTQHVLKLPLPPFDAAIQMQESPPHKRFFVGCSSPFVRYAERLTTLRSWC